MAAIDLGGGSVQEAFALTDAQAKAAPDPLYVTKLKGGGVEYSVYVHRCVCMPILIILIGTWCCGKGCRLALLHQTHAQLSFKAKFLFV